MKINTSYSLAADAYRKALSNMKTIAEKADVSREPLDIVSFGNRKNDLGTGKNDLINSRNSVADAGINDQIYKQQRQNTSQNILRAGDVIDVVNNSKANIVPKFTTFMRSLAQAKLRKIRSAEEYSDKALKGQASMMEVMTATNEAELILQQVLTVRDKFVSAYMEVLRMPL